MFLARSQEPTRKATRDVDKQRQAYAAGSYMEVHGAGFRTDPERVFELGTQLRGDAANWLVGLVESNAAELYDLEQFLLALRLRFEDLLTEEKARASLQRLRQGTRSISRN
uniref:Uncharacterized protein n=1 Tax=Sphaerodactylus townsendi TaxID=933632 RepID=A0ACB8EUK6_9SAUR